MKPSILGLMLHCWCLAYGIGCQNPPPKIPTPTPRAVAFGIELTACTENSKTCEESINCENETRKRYGEPPRDITKGCK